MRDSANAIWNFQVAVSYFTAQRLLGMFPLGDWGPLRAAQERCYEAGEAAKKSFRTNTMMFAAFQFADKAQSDIARLAKDTMTLKVLTPDWMTRVASLLFQGSTDAYESMATNEARSLLREQFQNTGDVIGFVNHPDAPDELSADGTYPLEKMVDKYYLRGDYPALWLMEGLGERYTHAYMAGGRTVRDLLTSGKAAQLPDKTQLMMHAGMGIAFAKDIVGDLTPWSAKTKVKDALRRFLDLVRQNSVDGYEGAAIESLGLVTRTWHGQMVTPISDELLELDADAREFFWHGAGRAMYFSPMYMLPGLSPFDAAEREPPDDTAKRNARAGVTWAFTIVNIRQPKIAANLLRHKADRVTEDGFTNGVHSTLVMAGDMVPGHRYVADFCKFQPEAGESADAWDRHIGRDIGEKIDRYRRVLKAHHRLGEVFRHHDLEELVADLDH